MLSIHNHHAFKALFQSVEHGTPVDASTFHGNVGAPGIAEPLYQRQELLPGGAKLTDLLTFPLVLPCRYEQAGNQEVFVDINASNAALAEFLPAFSQT